MRPSLSCLLLFALGIPVALMPAIVDARLWTLWPAYLGLTLLACGVDLLFGLPRRDLAVRARLPTLLYLGESHPLHLRLTAPSSRRPRTIEILCDLDERLAPQLRQTVALPRSGELRLQIPLVPLRRGTLAIRTLWLRWTGPLGLVRRTVRRAIRREVAAVPDVQAVKQAALRFFAAREFSSGLKVERYIGDGTEFESLREYVPGLDHRSMNWKVSARHRKLYCTDFRAERNHQVVLAVDSGHLMCEPIEGLLKLDRAINAALMLAYVCVKTGDRIGWFTFDEKVRTFGEPEGGMKAFRRLQRLSADIVYSPGETNFTLGLTQLSLRLRRRSLVVLLTDFVDTVTAELMIENLGRLARRHLVLFVTLRDPSLGRIAGRRPETLSRLHRAVVAGDFVRERDLVLRRLRRLGIHCIDAAPADISTALLNRYLELKRRELF
ncbi:MAG: DUF58 domain-containing protein [Planctomycetota bacterium]|jgi:uncharacterized protein (DUF58 family)